MHKMYLGMTHFFRHENGLPQTTHIFSGRFDLVYVFFLSFFPPPLPPLLPNNRIDDVLWWLGIMNAKERLPPLIAQLDTAAKQKDNTNLLLFIIFMYAALCYYHCNGQWSMSQICWLISSTEDVLSPFKNEGPVAGAGLYLFREDYYQLLRLPQHCWSLYHSIHNEDNTMPILPSTICPKSSVKGLICRKWLLR